MIQQIVILIYLPNASGFTKAPTLGTQIIIDEKGMVIADQKYIYGK